MQGKGDIHIFNSVDEFERETAEEIVRVMQEAIRTRGACFIVLSGGGTPRGVYCQLVSESLKRLVDWDKVHVFFSDERCVPPTDPQSNYGMVERQLLSRVGVVPDHVHRMRGESVPDEAAADYETVIQSAFRPGPPRFDLVLLGIGEDGHTASLFPSTEVLKKDRGLTSAVYVPRLENWRLTLTFPSINTGREVFILAVGESKASIVQRALTAQTPTAEIPITLVQPLQGSLRWMLDRQAASGLSASERS